MSTPNPPEALPEDRPVPSDEKAASAAPGQPSDDPSPAESVPDEAPGEEVSFAEMLSEFEQQHHTDATAGETLEGIVVTVSPTSVIVDIGMKREGVVPAEELLDKEGELRVKSGDRLTVSVVGRGPDGYYRLSVARVKIPTDWTSLEKALADGAVIGGMVSNVIKGGLVVDVGARAFMPASRSGTRDAAEMEALVGQEIRCKVIQLDTAKEDVVVDRRAVLEQEAAEARERTFQAITPGAVMKGTVRSLTDFGAFVDLGGIDGLLHVTDMSWGRIKKPSDVVSEGDEIEVKVLKVDPNGQRISLGLKQLTPDPWSLVAEKYPVGSKVRGVVVRLADFGAFVELEPGVDGLIHVSEMSWSKKQRKPSDVLRKGESVEVMVLSLKPEERRIGLGLKQALGDPWDEVDQRFPVGSTVEGTISNLAKFGAFVELGEGLEGLIHIGDITNEKRLDHPREQLSAGQTVRAAVLEIDQQRRRIRLGMKQLEPTSADEYIADHSEGDVVTGRVIEAKGKSAKVELGEGVVANCRAAKKVEQSETDTRGGDEKPDLEALTAMLASKWKQGSVQPSGGSSGEFQPGEVRSFRIVRLDPATKRIEIELA